MKNVLLIAALTSLTACSVRTPSTKVHVIEQCMVEQHDHGSTIICPDGTSVEVPNGQDGADGRDGVDGRDGLDAFVDIIDPCGDGPGQDELLIEMPDGRFIAWYKNLGLTELEPNTTYYTTDDQRCEFMIIGGEVHYD